MRNMRFEQGSVYVLVLLLTSLWFFWSGDTPMIGNKAGAERDSVESVLPQLIHPIRWDKEYHFANEKIPLENQDVYERLDRELTVNSYWHSSTILNLKLANKYFPIIEPILKANGVPDDFKYLAVAESGLRNVTSPAGAKGFWQFMKPTGKFYGLEVNAEVDERYHLEKATEAACTYIKHLKRKFGSWTLAAAAYNMGETKLDKNILDQGEKSYYDLNMNIESSRYVFRIVALKEIMENPAQFGFNVKEEDLYSPMSDFYLVEVDSTISSLAEFAHRNGITYRQLKVYNPWMLDSRLPDESRKLYKIKIPKQ